MKLTYLDWTVMVIYFVFVPGIGFALKRQIKTNADFFLSGRSIPAWITGLAFAVVSGLLAGFGLLGDKSSLRASLGINVNLGGGLVMLIFGVVMFLLGRRGTAAARLTEESPEGRKIEEVEHRAGLEK